MKSVAVIIVTFNRLPLLQECITSIRPQSFTDFQIIVVNNGSTDGTQEWLDSQSDIITITQDNLGGAGGFFTGIKYAAENGYQYCWLMDDDVICTENTLKELYNAHHIAENIGFVCSHVLGVNGNEMNVPNPDMRANNDSYPETFKFIDKQMVKVATATFVSILFKSELAYKIGLPYKEYFIWGDDFEYTQRISKNHPSYIVGSSLVIHKRVKQSSLKFETEISPNRLKNYFFYFRNSYYRQFKTGSLLWKLWFTINWSKKAVYFLKQKDYNRARILWNAYKAILTFNPKISFPKNPGNSYDNNAC